MKCLMIMIIIQRPEINPMRKAQKRMQKAIIAMQKGVLLWLMVLRHTPKGVKHRRPAIIPTLKAKKRWQVV